MRAKGGSDRQIARLGLSKKERAVVAQYESGMRDGMRIAYAAVARRLLSLGRSEAEIRRFLQDMTTPAEIRSILAELREDKTEE